MRENGDIVESSFISHFLHNAIRTYTRTHENSKPRERKDIRKSNPRCKRERDHFSFLDDDDGQCIISLLSSSLSLSLRNHACIRRLQQDKEKEKKRTSSKVVRRRRLFFRDPVFRCSNVTILYTRNDAGLIVNLFVDGMYKLKLAYLPLFFLYNLSPS